MPRYTNYIELQEYEKLRSYAFNSKEIACPFDCHLIIRLEKLGLIPKECGNDWRRIRQCIKRFHEKHGVTFACVWTFENVPSIGVHVHCLLHRGHLIDKTYRGQLLRAISFRHIGADMIKIVPYKGFRTWAQNTEYLTQYICKGIREEHWGRFTYKKNLSYQGEIIGRRVGWTRNL